ncbi:MAG: biotin/lipoyl-binding protein, partial [Thermoanaerobaculia bacterium]
MKKRMFLMLSVVVVFIGAVGGFKFLQIRDAMAQGAAYQPPPEAVTTIVAHQEQWADKLKAIGTVVAVNGVDVSADLPGVVEQIHFESGRPVEKGSVLVTLDTRQERAQLAAAVAERDRLAVDLR